jgi:hypothetical protein
MLLAADGEGLDGSIGIENLPGGSDKGRPPLVRVLDITAAM